MTIIKGCQDCRHFEFEAASIPVLTDERSERRFCRFTEIGYCRNSASSNCNTRQEGCDDDSKLMANP